MAKGKVNQGKALTKTHIAKAVMQHNVQLAQQVRQETVHFTLQCVAEVLQEILVEKHKYGERALKAFNEDFNARVIAKFGGGNDAR